MYQNYVERDVRINASKPELILIFEKEKARQQRKVDSNIASDPKGGKINCQLICEKLRLEKFTTNNTVIMSFSAKSSFLFEQKIILVMIVAHPGYQIYWPLTSLM